MFNSFRFCKPNWTFWLLKTKKTFFLFYLAILYIKMRTRLNQAILKAKFGWIWPNLVNEFISNSDSVKNEFVLCDFIVIPNSSEITKSSNVRITKPAIIWLKLKEKNALSSPPIIESADTKTANNKGRLYSSTKQTSSWN